LPKWLGWVAIVLAIVTATPAALIGIVALIFWTAIVSVLVWRRSGPDAEPAPADAGVAMGTQ
jgi:hypothetical protein